MRLLTWLREFDKARWFLPALLVLSFLVFAPALGHDFVNLDDTDFLLKNQLVRSLSLDNIRAIFLQSSLGVYVPLTVLSFAVEYHFFGYDPSVYHGTNMILHVFNVALVFWLARRMGLSAAGAFFAGLLFAVHPMRVESVVWVTERKDVLYAFFFLLSIHAYLQYLVRRRAVFFVLSVVLGLLSLLAKPAALCLPFVLAVLQYYQGQRKISWGLVADKTIYFLYIIPLIAISYSSISLNIPFDPLRNLLTASYTFTFYLQKFFFPAVITPFYDLPACVSLAEPQVLFGLVWFVAYIFLAIRFHKDKWVSLANAFYVVTIFFMLRFDFNYYSTPVGDRFMYLPSIGFCLLFGAGWDRLAALPRRRFIPAVAGVVVIFTLLIIKTEQMIGVWRNSEVFWRYLDRTSGDNYFVNFYQGELAFHRGDCDVAIAYLSNSIAMRPERIRPFYFRGLCYKRKGMFAPAREDLSRAIMNNVQAPVNLRMDFHDLYLERGLLFFEARQYQDALADFDQAVRNQPNSARAYNNRGSVFYLLGNYPAALRDFDRSISLDPRAESTRRNRTRAADRLK